jgi:hypothetical protein
MISSGGAGEEPRPGDRANLASKESARVASAANSKSAVARY